MSKSQKIKYTIGILLVFSIINVRMNMSLTLADIAAAFPNEPTTRIQLCITIGSLVAIPTCLIVGPLAGVISKKKIIVIGLILSIIGGLLPVITKTNSLMPFILSGAIVGLGYNLFQPTGNALCPELFEGDDLTRIVGRKVISQMVVGMGITLITGWLMLKSWTNLYWSFLFLIPALIGVIFLLPEGRLEKPEKGEKSNIFSGYMIMQYVFSFVLSLCYGSYSLNIAFALADNGINTAFGSVLSTCFQIAQLVLCLFLVFYQKICKGKGLMVSTVIFTITMWILTFAKSSIPYATASFLYGIGFGGYWIMGVIDIPKHVSKNAVTKAMALWSAVSFGAPFVNPYLITKGADFLLNGTVTDRFLISSVIMTVTLIGCLIANAAIQKKEKAAAELTALNDAK